MKLFNIPLVMLFTVIRAQTDVDICATDCLQAAACFAEGAGCASLDQDTMMWSGIYEPCNGDDKGGALDCVECYPGCVQGNVDPVDLCTDCVGAAPCFAEGAGCDSFDKDTQKWSGFYDGCNGDDNGGALNCASCFPDCDATSSMESEPFLESSPMSPEDQQEICALCSTSPLNEKGISDDCYNAVGGAGVLSADMDAACDAEGPEDVSIACKSAVFTFYNCDFDNDGDGVVPTNFPISLPTSTVPTNFPISLPTSTVPTNFPISLPTSTVPTNFPISLPTSTVPTNFPISLPASISTSIPTTAGEADPCSTLCVPAAPCFAEGAGCANFDKLTQKWSGMYDGCNGNDNGSAINCAPCYPDCDTSSSSSLPPTNAPVSSPVAEVVPTSKAPVVSPAADAKVVGQEESSSNIIVPSILLVLVMTVAGIVAV